MSAFRHVPSPPPVLTALSAMLTGPLSHAACSGNERCPPELHVFGRTRSGALMGVVVPAPEVPSPTWYVAEFHPDNGANGLFATCRAGALGFAKHWGASASVMSTLSAVSEQRVGLPVDYISLQGADGLPLWVPRGSWRESDVGALVRPELVVDRLQELLSEGRAGSALHLGRYMSHALGRYPEQDALLADIWGVLATVYDALGRPQYASIARARAPSQAPGLVPTTAGLPAHALAMLGTLVRRDLHGFTGVRRAHMVASGPQRTQGPMELTVFADVALDLTRREEGADLAHIVLSQAWDGGQSLGPVHLHVATLGRRLDPSTPPPDPCDPVAVRNFERGYITIGGDVALGQREGDLNPLVPWLD